MRAVVAERGQITIPKILRQQLGIKPGTVLELHVEKATLIGVKLTQQDAIAKVYGCLNKIISSTDKTIDELRGKE